MSAEPVYGVVTAPEADDDEHFQVLFRRYYGRVKGLAARRFPACDSDDVAQETMVRVLVHVRRLDPSRDPWPYIAAIAVNVGRDLSKTKVTEVVLTEETYEREVAPAADEPVLAAARDQAVQNVLRELAPASRQVLALQAFEEMSVGEIARFLGSNDNAVRQKLFRARRQFRRALASVPSGAFGVAAFVRRVRRRVSAGQLVQGSGLSLGGAAVLAVAVVGAVSVGVVPGIGHGSHVRQDVVVTRLGAEVREAPEVPARYTATTARPVAAEAVPASPRVAPAERKPVDVTVKRPGNIWKHGETNREAFHVRVTEDYEIYLENYGWNSEGRSPACRLLQRVGACS